jgi:hypothetical protein
VSLPSRFLSSGLTIREVDHGDALEVNNPSHPQLSLYSNGRMVKIFCSDSDEVSACSTITRKQAEHIHKYLQDYIKKHPAYFIPCEARIINPEWFHGENNI